MSTRNAATQRADTRPTGVTVGDVSVVGVVDVGDTTSSLPGTDTDDVVNCCRD